MTEVDWGKAIGITMIVTGHFLQGGNALKTIFYSLHVPFFFILSGILFSPGRPVEHITKRFFRLIVPYVLYSVLSLPYYVCISTDLSVSELIRKIWFFDGIPVWNGPLWFLPVLFVVDVVFCLLWAVFSKLRKNETGGAKSGQFLCTFLFLGVLIAGAYFAGLWFEHKGIQRYFLFGLNKAVLMLGFYAFGVLLRQLGTVGGEAKLSLRWKIGLSVFLVLFSVAALLLHGENTPSPISFAYNGKLWAYFPLACAGSLALLLLFRGTRVPYAVELLSRHSLFIMATHYFLLEIWKKIPSGGGQRCTCAARRSSGDDGNLYLYIGAL